MQDVVIAVRGMISDGTHEIELLVHSHNLGNPSPCHIYENGVYRGMIGGSIDSLDQIFSLQVAKYPGFAVKGRGYHFARINSQKAQDTRTNGTSRTETDGFQ